MRRGASSSSSSSSISADGDGVSQWQSRRRDVMAADVESGVVSSLGRRCRRDSNHHHHHHHHQSQQDDELREFAQTTSLHGVPRVISARSLVTRVFWSTVCLAAFLMFLGNSAGLLHQYRSYPKKVRCLVVLFVGRVLVVSLDANSSTIE